MSEITVRPLGADDWETYRSIRLTALQESPDAFVATHADEEERPESFWRERMARSRRLAATVGKEVVGVVSVGEAQEADNAGELFGLWVRPEKRGTGVATELVKAAAAAALAAGKSQLYYWVGTDNGRAVAFASGYGFRPTHHRRPMRVVSEADGEEEIAMTLPLGG